ncbi:60S ribosomal protein L10e [Theileria orientalis]|uniref:Ribosome assembly factor mrt4 n=1 Tax=Theileria orientalis TaxID=68886 RepID=A0A976XKB2_THEOR|nr:60S ribosomal protein L10e [Theileria orientalis]
MPSSKRKTKTQLTSCKKDSKKKLNLINNIRGTLENFIRNNKNDSTFVYIIAINDQRNSPLKTLRSILLPGRVFYGKNKVMRIALGTKPEDEIQENLHKISENLFGESAILITSEMPDVVIEKVNGFKVRDFAKCDKVAKETIILKEGGDDFKEIPGSMEPQFRKLGVPTALNMGKIVLMGDFIVCEKDKTISPNQSQILKLLGIRMSLFSATVIGFWNDGHYKELTPNTHQNESL